MPSQDRVRLNDVRQIEQAWPEPSHPYQQCSITPTKPQMVRYTPQGNIELLPEKEVLDFKLTPPPEQVGDERPEQMRLARASKDGIFGNDRSIGEFLRRTADIDPGKALSGSDFIWEHLRAGRQPHRTEGRLSFRRGRCCADRLSRQTSRRRSSGQRDARR